MKKNVLNQTMTTKNFNAAFKAVKNESENLNSALRAIIETAAGCGEAAKDAKQVAAWLEISAESMKKSNRTETRKKVLESLVFYQIIEGVTSPARLTEPICVEGVNYYKAGSANWLPALKMICNRKNKGLDPKHIELTEGVEYTPAGEVVTDETLLAKIKKAREEKQATEKLKKEQQAEAIRLGKIEIAKNKTFENILI